MNNCTTSVAVDGKGRAWVVTYSRQLKIEEQVQTQMSMSMDAAGPRIRRKEGGDDGEDGNTSLNSPPSGDPEALEAVGKRQLGEKTALSRAGDIIRFYNFDPIRRRGYFVGPELPPMERDDHERGRRDRLPQSQRADIQGRGIFVEGRFDDPDDRGQ